MTKKQNRAAGTSTENIVIKKQEHTQVNVFGF